MASLFTGPRGTVRRRAGWVLLAAAVLLARAAAADPAVRATGASEPPQWCKAIAGGALCAPLSAAVPRFCGTKPVSLAWADGFAANPWRQLSAAAAINEASRCPNVTGWEHTDGQGNTQKAISDIGALAAKGTSAIVVFADAGPALLPAIRSAFEHGSTVVPFRALVGGQEGKDYSLFVKNDMTKDGLDWGTWMGKTLGGKGEIAYLSGPPGNSQGRQRSAGIHQALEGYPGIKFVGQQPFEPTDWQASKTVQDITALNARYPTIDGVIVDMGFPLITSRVFERSLRPLPAIAGEDYNALGCEWMKLKKLGREKEVRIRTTSSQSWGIRLAVRWAIALAAGGTVDEPLVIDGPDGKPHVVSQPGDKSYSNFPVNDTTAGAVFCDPKVPMSSPGGTSLSTAQVLAALKGGL